MSETLEALLQEGRTFPPPDSFRKRVELVQERFHHRSGVAAGAPDDMIALDGDLVSRERAASRFPARQIGSPLRDARLRLESEHDAISSTPAP